MRIPGSTTNGSRAVRVEQHDPDLAAVAGVDEPGRVDDADAVARREPRARLDEAGVALGDLDREPGRRRRPARPGSSIDAARRRRGRARRRPRTPALGQLASSAAGAAPATSITSCRRLVEPRSGSPATRIAREARRPRRAAAARGRARPRACRGARRSARRARRAPRARGRPRTARAAGRPRSGRRRARRSASSSSSSPSPVLAETWSARGNACSSRRRASGSSTVDLVQDELDAGCRRRRSRRARRATAAIVSREPLLRERRVGDVQDEIGDERLLERRGEALDELGRQPADEARRCP